MTRGFAPVPAKGVQVPGSVSKLVKDSKVYRYISRNSMVKFDKFLSPKIGLTLFIHSLPLTPKSYKLKSQLISTDLVSLIG
jgi:hypothetical protein